VLAGFVPFSTPSFKYYQHIKIPSPKRASLVEKLERLTIKVRELRINVYMRVASFLGFESFLKFKNVAHIYDHSLIMKC
jgi:hypothetical protein